MGEGGSSSGEERGVANECNGGGAARQFRDAMMTRPQSRGEEARRCEAGVVVDEEKTLSIRGTGRTVWCCR